jgi:diguanylate cyclase (GGDEF)-like protein
MLETSRVESPVYLRHEYRTPVNHIVGYSELLIDEAAERRLEPFIPSLRQISEGGHKLLEKIQEAFSEQASAENAWNGEAFKSSLDAMAIEMSHTLASLDENLDQDHRETLADLDAISGAIKRLAELAGNGPKRGAQPDRQTRQRLRLEDLPRDVPQASSQRVAGRILIADDDAANRELLRRRLLCEGHKVVEVANGLEVLDYLRQNPCDLVLLDILMPGMDGFQTLARMKQDLRLRELPVIMISALEEMQSVVRCIEMGAEDYLTKPFNRVLLRARIGACLDRKRLMDRERRKTEELERTLGLLEQAQEQLSMQASRDALTGLANRRSAEAQLELRVQRGEPFTAIYIDLNGFKKINDTYGHAVGDELLREVGVRMRLAFRSTDATGRWGGDEFVAFVDADAAEAQPQIRRIRDSLSEHFVISGSQNRVSIGAAVGSATWRPNDTASAVLHRADFAMYEDKLRTGG